MEGQLVGETRLYPNPSIRSLVPPYFTHAGPVTVKETEMRGEIILPIISQSLDAI